MKKSILLPLMLFMFVFVNSVTAQTEVKINHDGTDGFAVEADGTIRADGTATTWDDLKVPFNSSLKGSNSLPDFDFTNIGLLFPNDAAEAVYFIVQMPHKYMEGTDIYPHIHWQQTADDQIAIWSMGYKWFNNNEIIPTIFSSLATTANDTVFDYGSRSGSLAQISSFPAIPGSANSLGSGLSASKKTISSILLVKLWRSGGPSVDILAFEFDIHYEIDTQGSRMEFYKNNQ